MLVLPRAEQTATAVCISRINSSKKPRPRPMPAKIRRVYHSRRSLIDPPRRLHDHRHSKRNAPEAEEHDAPQGQPLAAPISGEACSSHCY